MNKGIIAHIWSNGNSSVGIGGRETNIDTCLIVFKDDNHRSFVRLQLEQCFTLLWNDKAKVLFVDELDTLTN